MSNSITTIMVKLYKPTKIKQAILDEAIQNYTKAYQYLFDKAMLEIDFIKEIFVDNVGKYTAFSIKKWITKDIDKCLNQFSIEPFKDSLKLDFSSAFAGYLNYPSKSKKVSSSCAKDSQFYEKKMYTHQSVENENTTDEFSFQSTCKAKPSIDSAALDNKTRPIYFCRYSTIRNYSLLYNPQTQKYYAKIYLMNVKNKNRRSIVYQTDIKLYYIDKRKSKFKETTTKKSFLLFPLAFGKYQEEALRKVRENPEIIKTARLIKKSKEYFLAINLECETPKALKTDSYMGLARGIENSINYAIVGNTSIILDQDFYQIDNFNVNSNALHKITNEIVAKAYASKSQIIVERLSDKGDALSFISNTGSVHLPKFSALKYNNLVRLLDYKTQNAGLPKPIKVSSLNIFSTCPKCENNSKSNRFSEKLIICTSCGGITKVDEAGVLNLSTKLIKYNSDKIKIKLNNSPDGLKFSNLDLGLSYSTTNLDNCYEEFIKEIDMLIKSFYDNIEVEQTKINFMKKLSLIKKLEENKNAFEFIHIY